MGRQRRDDPIERLWRFVQDLVHRRRERIGLERLPGAQQLVDDDTEGKDVGAMVGLLAAQLFGRHVVDRANHHVAARHLRGDESRQAEIEDLGLPVVGDEDIGRLDVAVNHAGRVRVRETFAHHQGNLQLP